MRQIRAVGAVEGRPVAYFGHRRLYPGDVVSIADDAPLPSWAVEVGKKEKVDPASIKAPGIPRRFDAPNAKKRGVGIDGVGVAVDAATLSEAAGLTAVPPSAAEALATSSREREVAERERKRAADQDVLNPGGQS